MITLSLVVLVTACFQSIVVDCAEISDAQDRLQCYDDAVTQIQNAPADRPIDQPTKTAQPKPQELFGKSPSEVSRELTGEPDLPAIEAQVTSVAEIAYGKLQLTLDNQQTWRQVDSAHLRVREGDYVVIERAFAGSYLLKKSTGGRQIRVQRTR